MSIRVGVICPSEIAFRRFLPSLMRSTEFSFEGIAVATPKEWSGKENVNDNVINSLKREKEKAESFVSSFGGRIFDGYETLIKSDDIDAVYLPLPPALHHKWARLALENNKSVYVEKPFTTRLADTLDLINLAKAKGLSVHENYMFIFHDQLKVIKELISNGEVGKVRQYRISFGFPRRALNDFRYNKELGGGALLDAGGYCIKYASDILGNTAKIVCANSYYEDDFDVDIFGSATLINNEGITAQIAFGMDNDYKCDLEVWGSTGYLTTHRVLTAPDGYEPEYEIKHNQDVISGKLPSDFAFEKSIKRFFDCLTNKEIREENYQIIERQAQLVNDFQKISKYDK